MQCLLSCVSKQVRDVTRGVANCNMIAFNWCVRFSGCAQESDLQQQRSDTEHPSSALFNPFRRGCEHRYTVIHNKCPWSEGNICMAVSPDGSMEQRLRGTDGRFPADAPTDCPPKIPDTRKSLASPSA